jgi:hypothetical protein
MKSRLHPIFFMGGGLVLDLLLLFCFFPTILKWLKVFTFLQNVKKLSYWEKQNYNFIKIDLNFPAAALWIHLKDLLDF